MSAAISATQVRYIKLGKHGGWVRECLDNEIIRLGFGTAKQSRFRLCQKRDWDGLKKSFLDQGESLREAANFSKQIRLFFEDDGTTLWITFHADRMYWGFLGPNPPHPHRDGDGIWRTVANGWRCDDSNGALLLEGRLSEALTKYAMFPGTSCNVDVADYVIRQINRRAMFHEGKIHSAPPTTREAADLEPPERIQSTTYRILRDTAKSRRVKKCHHFRCQICGKTIEFPDGSRYAEGHHIQPLGGEHKGPDVEGNILCLCPNHHAELDLGVLPIRLSSLRSVKGHTVEQKYVDYHNRVICNSRRN